MRRRKRANGEGTIIQRPSGVWVAITSRPERRAFTGATQAEAIRRRNEWQAQHGSIKHANAKQNAATYFRLWLASKRKNVRDRTFDGYSSLITNHVVPAVKDYRLCDLAPQHIQAMLDAISAPWVRWQTYRLVKEALALAVTWEVLRRSPVARVTAPRKPSAVAQPLTEGHYYALLDEIQKDRLCALWLLFLTVGPRRGEAIALARSAVGDGRTLTFTRSLQRVRGELVFLPAKSDTSNRTVELVPEVTEAIMALLESQDADREKAGRDWQEHDLVFCTRVGTPLEPRNVSRRWHQLLKRAKVPAIKLHASRHTVASMLLRDGADIYAVQALLGHASPSLTVSTYGHRMSGPSVTAEKMGAVLKRRPT